MPNKRFEKITWANNTTTWFFRLLGWTLVLGQAGNCIPRCLHLQKDNINWLHLTYRTGRFTEWSFYFRRSGAVHWNSEWIARRLGEYRDSDFGGWYSYSGVLGHHSDL